MDADTFLTAATNVSELPPHAVQAAALKPKSLAVLLLPVCSNCATIRVGSC